MTITSSKSTQDAAFAAFDAHVAKHGHPVRRADAIRDMMQSLHLEGNWGQAKSLYEDWRRGVVEPVVDANYLADAQDYITTIRATDDKRPANLRTMLTVLSRDLDDYEDDMSLKLLRMTNYADALQQEVARVQGNTLLVWNQDLTSAPRDQLVFTITHVWNGMYGPKGTARIDQMFVTTDGRFMYDYDGFFSYKVLAWCLPPAVPEVFQNLVAMAEVAV